MFRKLLLFKFAPESKDLALLFLRVIAAVNILLKHGLEKVLDYQGMYLRLSANHFYVIPLGVGISLFCATVADAILTVPLALGLATRWCALLCFVNEVSSRACREVSNGLNVRQGKSSPALFI